MLLAPPTVWLPLLRSCMKNLVGTSFFLFNIIFLKKKIQIMICDCEFSINFAGIVKGTMTTTHSYTGDQVYILLTPSRKFCPA